MDEATANFFTTHATPLLSNRVPQGTQAQPDGGAGAHVTVVGPSNNDSTPQGDQAYSSNMGSAGSACAQLNITSFIPAPPSLQPTNPQQNIADFATACNDWSPSNGGAAAIAASLAPSQSMPPPQDASILAPQFCGFSPQATGCGQFSSYPEWYEPQNTNDDGIYLQTQGCYAPHGLYTDDPTTSPLSDFNSRRRATIDSSFLQQPDGMPIYSPNVIDPEPTSASGYFAMPQYAEATLHESPPGALLYLQHYGLPGEHQAAELPRGEKKSGTDKMKRKRGRPPTRIDTIEARRTPPNEWTGGSPVSTSTVLSTRSEPIPDSGAPTKTCNSRSTTLQARNRAAANRYRAKTQAAVAQLEAEEREVTMRRQSLLMCAGELLDQVFQLKNEVFRHANCGCPRIEGYLENAAQQAYSKQGVLTPSLSSAGVALRPDHLHKRLTD